MIAFLAFISSLLAFGIDVSLPAFDELRDHFDLAEGSGEVSLVVTFYFLGMAGGQLFYGPFADRFGRRPVLTVGLAIYAVGATGAATATSMEMLLAARLLWGLGAASAMVLYTAMARDLYEGDQMARVMTLVMAVFLIGPMIVPALGELLLLTGSWRSVFVFGVLLALVAIAWSRRFGETLPDERRRPLEFGETLTAFRAVFRSPRLFRLHAHGHVRRGGVLHLPRFGPTGDRRDLRIRRLVRPDLRGRVGGDRDRAAGLEPAHDAIRSRSGGSRRQRPHRRFRRPPHDHQPRHRR